MPAIGEEIELPYVTSELSEIKLPPVKNLPRYLQVNHDMDFEWKNYD